MFHVVVFMTHKPMTVVASDHVIIAGTPLPQQNQIGVVMQWICIQN